MVADRMRQVISSAQYLYSHAGVASASDYSPNQVRRGGAGGLGTSPGP